MIVGMCLLPEVEVLQSVTRSMAILSNGLSGISVICERVLLNFCFVMPTEGTVSDVFPYVLVHAFPIVLSFD